MENHELTFRQFQNQVRDRYFARDLERGAPATFLWLLEEVGELATALNLASMGSRDQANLEEEFADVLAWVFTLANLSNVDIAEALRKKYLTGEGPRGHK